MRDYAKLIKALRYCSEQDNCGSQCPKFDRGEKCRDEIETDAADAIEELLAKGTNAPDINVGNKWISVRDVSDGEICAAKMVLSVIENLDKPILMFDIEKSAVKKALLLMLRICEAEPPKGVE
jgi:hypothetical protein